MFNRMGQFILQFTKPVTATATTINNNPSAPPTTTVPFDPCGICYNRATQQIIVADGENHCLQVFLSNGKHVQTIGGKGNQDGSKFDTPLGIGCGGDGSIVVADRQSWSVVILERRGKFVGKFGLTHPRGVAVDSGGLIYVTDKSSVQIY